MERAAPIAEPDGRRSRAKQYARLLGVMVKQPFTVEAKRRKFAKTTQSLPSVRDEVLWDRGLRSAVLPEEPRRPGSPDSAGACQRGASAVADEEALRLLLQDAKL